MNNKFVTEYDPTIGWQNLSFQILWKILEIYFVRFLLWIFRGCLQKGIHYQRQQH